MHDLIAFQRDLLYVIAAMDEPSGLAIKRELDPYYETDITPARLYPNLDALVERGFVQKGRHDKRTNSYTLTRRGRRELDERSEWEAHLMTARIDQSSSETDDTSTSVNSPA